MYSRGTISLPLKNAHVREAVFCCNERLAGALILPPNGRGGRTPLDERDGVLVITPDFKTFTSWPSTLIQPAVV